MTKQRRKHVSKRSERFKKTKKLVVKKKFKKAIAHLSKVSKDKQRKILKNASNEFIVDIQNFFRSIRRKAYLFNAAQRKVLKKYKRNLQKLVNSKVTLKTKRKILSMKGGLPPLALILAAYASTAMMESSRAIRAEKRRQ